jgi:hypothetical protein
MFTDRYREVVVPRARQKIYRQTSYNCDTTMIRCGRWRVDHQDVRQPDSGGKQKGTSKLEL